MNRIPTVLAAAALLCGTTAIAQMKPAPKATVAAKAAPAAKPAPAKPAPMMAAKPMAASKPAAKPRAATAPGGRMVSAKLANGKTVTYNCALAGNKTKKVCQ